MCGHVGIAGNLRLVDIEIFQQMLIADTFRGVHSTGVAAIDVDKQYQPEIVKYPVPAWDFLEFKGAGSIINVHAQILMGHNRHATMGEVNKANAHPFLVQDSLVGAHNGTLHKHSSKKFITDWDDFGTDSEAALNSFATRGEVETLQNIGGAWAFVWYNYLDNTLNFTRNDQRPFAYAYDPDNPERIYWASEVEMLRWILHRNGQLGSGNKGVRLFTLNPLRVVSFKVPGTYKENFDAEPKVYPYEELEVPTYGQWFQGYEKQKKPKQPSQPRAIADNRIDTAIKFKGIEAIDQVLFPTGWKAGDDWLHVDDRGMAIIGEDARLSFVKNAECACCGAKIEADERWRVFPHKTFVCEQCAESTETAEILYNGGVTAA